MKTFFFKGAAKASVHLAENAAINHRTICTNTAAGVNSLSNAGTRLQTQIYESVPNLDVPGGCSSPPFWSL